MDSRLSAGSPHGDHLREAAGLKDGGHQQHVCASVDQVTQWLVIGEAASRSVRVLTSHLRCHPIEFILHEGEKMSVL